MPRISKSDYGSTWRLGVIGYCLTEKFGVMGSRPVLESYKEKRGVSSHQKKIDSIVKNC